MKTVKEFVDTEIWPIIEELLSDAFYLLWDDDYASDLLEAAQRGGLDQETITEIITSAVDAWYSEDQHQQDRSLVLDRIEELAHAEFRLDRMIAFLITHITEMRDQDTYDYVYGPYIEDDNYEYFEVCDDLYAYNGDDDNDDDEGDDADVFAIDLC